MNINSINDVYTLLGTVKSASDSSTVKRISDITGFTDPFFDDKYIPQDKESSKASAQIIDKYTHTPYDYRFRTGVPLSKPQNSERTYNNTQKNVKRDEDRKSFSEYIEFVEITEGSPKQPATGTGYYIVPGENSGTPKKNIPSTPQDLWRARIKGAYKQDAQRSNGSLVNLVF